MACFLVPATEAIVMSMATKVMKSKEKASATLKSTSGNEVIGSDMDITIPFSRKLSWLTNLLWGGSFLLAYEHLWHGEVVPWFPFLTAASNSADTAAMLHEMSTVGVSMAIVVTAFWGCMVLVSNAMAKKAIKTEATAKQGGSI